MTTVSRENSAIKMESAVALDRIENKTDEPIKVCFVCTGNTCRSPMAAAVLNHLGKGNYRAVSAGLAVHSARDMSENAKRALKNKGIEPPPHISRQLSEDDIDNNDIVIGMTEGHYMIMMQALPQYLSKLESMPADVGDPYGGTLETYEKCLGKITEAIKERFSL